MSIVDLSDSGYMTQIINLYIGLFGELIQSLCFSYFYRSKALTIKDMIKIQIQNCTNHWSEKVQFSSVQSLIRVRLFATPWAAACQASLSFTNSWSLLKFTCIELVMPCNHLILCCPFLFPPSIFPSIRVFSNESVLRIRWPKYRNFSFNISPSNEYSGLISFRMDWLDLL